MGRLTAEFLAPLLALNELQTGQAGDCPREWPSTVVDSVLHGGVGFCLLDTMRSYSAATNQLLDTLQAVVATHAADIDTRVDDIVHFDFTPANILVGDRHITGVIDWGGACAGDRAFDLATLLFYNYDQPEICAYASSTVLREMPNLCASTRVAGNRIPAISFPAKIAVRRLS